MAYSSAHNESYGNVRAQSQSMHEDTISLPQSHEVHEYLDLGFAWLNDYDKAGNYRSHEYRESKSENPYGWDALRETRQNPPKPKVKDVRKKNKRKLRDTLQPNNTGDLRQSGKVELRETVKSNFIGETQKENPYGWKQLGATRKTTYRTSDDNTLRQTRENEPKMTVHIGYIDETRKENPYGWNALGRTRKPPSRTTDISGHRKTGKRELTETVQSNFFSETQQENPYGWKALGSTQKAPPRTSDIREHSKIRETRKDDLRETVQSNFIGETQKENPYGWKALGRTRRTPSHTSDTSKLRQTRKDELGETVQSNFIDATQKENPYGLKASDPTRNARPRSSRVKLKHSRQTKLRETVQSGITSVTQEENPYGWRALGRTRRVPSITTDAEVHAKAASDDLRGTTVENPYGWKVLGPTRRSVSVTSNTENSVQRPQKRTHKESVLKTRLVASGRYERDIMQSSVRKIKQAKRLSALPEEITRGGELRDGRLRRTTIESTVVSGNEFGTTGGGDFGKTYDYPYVRNITREETPDPVVLQPGVLLKPERRLNWNLTHTRPHHTSTRWTDMATDEHAMKTWHELFAKIKKKWSANYKDPSFLSGLTGDTSFTRAEYISRHRKRKEMRRLKLIIICAVVVGVLVAVIVPVVVLTTYSKS